MDHNEALPVDDEKTREAKAKLPKLSDTNAFTIFIAGLSNGWAYDRSNPTGHEAGCSSQDAPAELPASIGDNITLKSEQIKYLPPAQWIYRISPSFFPRCRDGSKPLDASRDRSPGVAMPGLSVGPIVPISKRNRILVVVVLVSLVRIHRHGWGEGRRTRFCGGRRDPIATSCYHLLIGPVPGQTRTILWVAASSQSAAHRLLQTIRQPHLPAFR